MQPDPAILETSQCLCLAARRAARTITREFDDALRPHGLRATQFTLLAALAQAGPQSIGDLAGLLSADRTTLTRNLAVAAQRRLVELHTDAIDARSRRAAITPAGKRALAAALPAWRATQRRLAGRIGDAAAASLRRLAGGPCTIELAQRQPPARKEMQR